MASNEELKLQHDVTTTLKSELAAIQYKKDRLVNELQDVKSQLRNREQRTIELQNEVEQLKEQSARQNAIISSLRERIKELEEHERALTNSLTRTEMTIETLTRENRYQSERNSDLELKLTHLDIDRNSEEQNRKQSQKAVNDIVRRLANALGTETTEFSTSEAAIHKATELIQGVSTIRSRSLTLSESLMNVEGELRACRDQLDKACMERDSLQRQATSNLIEIERLKQEKESFEKQLKIMEHELSETRDKLSLMTRNYNTATRDISSKEVIISNLRDELKEKDEKGHETENEITHLLESLAIITSTPTQFVQPQPLAIKERIREIVHEKKEKELELDDLKEKYINITEHSNHEKELRLQEENRLKSLENERFVLESRLHKTESELTACEIAKESLKRDKAIFVAFLERLSNVLSMDEIAKEIGVDLHTESILLRAEQLAKAETGKIVDKIHYRSLAQPRFRREKSSFESIPNSDSAVVFQLQRRIRTLRDQLQRRDLHLDLLRKKLNMQEDNSRMRSILEAEKEEANNRAKKYQKQVDKLQAQLAETKAISRELRSQLTDAEDFKKKAVENSEEIDDLQRRLMDSEVLRTRYLQKVTSLKDQLRSISDNYEQEKLMNDRTLKLLKEELISVKQNLSDYQRAENLLSDLRRSVAKLLGLDPTTPDYEIISRLSKLVNAHREFTLVSKRYDEPLPTSNYATLADQLTLPIPKSSAERSKYIDSLLEDIDSEINSCYNKRPNPNRTV